jgi:SecD/SecF fusion protein
MSGFCRQARRRWPSSPVRVLLRALSRAGVGLATAALVVAGCGGSSHTKGMRSANIGTVPGATLLYRVLPTPDAAVTRASVADTVRILERRAGLLGFPNSVAPVGPNLISIALTNAQNIHRIEEWVGTTARLEFYDWEANALTPSGRSVSQLLRTRDPAAVAISQGSRTAPEVGGPGAGSLSLYDAVRLAAKEHEQISPDNARLGPEYFMFGAPGSAACTIAARDQQTAPTPREHCYLAGPQDTRSHLYASLPTGLTASEGDVLTVQQGTTVLQASPPQPPAGLGWGDPKAQFYVLKDHVWIFGHDIADAHQSTEPPAPSPDDSLTFTRGGQAFYQTLTAQVARRGALLSGHGKTYDQHFAIALDTQLLSVPFIDFRFFPDGIAGNTGAAIFGGFTLTSARNLAAELRLGELPLNLTLIAEKTVQAAG